jgi:hypothetical protein
MLSLEMEVEGLQGLAVMCNSAFVATTPENVIGILPE